MRLFAAIIGLTIVGLVVQKVNAISSANISHAYTSTSSITNGSIVSLDPKCSNCVQPANVSNDNLLLGVAVANDQSLLAVDPSNQPSSVQVATTGTALVLASNLNGNIAVGDQISVSPFNGVGMRAAPGLETIGLAQTALNTNSPGVTTQEVTQKNNKKSIVQIGYVRISIAIGLSTTSNSSTGLNNLQRLAKSLTGNTVSTLRVATGLLVALIAIVALVVSTYASVFGSIISVGRNPLAKFAIFRTLASVLSLAAITTFLAGLIIFLLLH
jgi:hypothetical protein